MSNTTTTNSASSSSPPSSDQNCVDIEKALFGSNYAVLHLHLLVNALALIAMGVLVRQYCKKRIAIHRNLKLLLANIIILYFVNSFVWFVFFLRYRILMYAFKHPCDFLSPVWMVPVFLGPLKLYAIAYPFFHFAITFERFCSTFFAQKYERMGTQLISKIIWMIWLLSSAYIVFILCVALADPDISGHPQGIVTITTANNANAMLAGTIVTMALVILTALCDWCIFMWNKRIHRETRKNASEYSLSLNYQIYENTKALLVIFPIDISYAIIYPLYNILVIIIRAYRSVLSTADFVTYCYWANTPLFIHALISVLMYIRFIRKFSGQTRGRRRSLVKKSPNEQAKIYFQQLEKQWK